MSEVVFEHYACATCVRCACGTRSIARITEEEMMTGTAIRRAFDKSLQDAMPEMRADAKRMQESPRILDSLGVNQGQQMKHIKDVARALVARIDEKEREPRSPWDEMVYDSLLDISDVLISIAHELERQE